MRASLPAQGLTDLPDQRRIPGRDKRNSRREAGRLEASTKTQVVGVSSSWIRSPCGPSARRSDRRPAAGKDAVDQ